MWSSTCSSSSTAKPSTIRTSRAISSCCGCLTPGAIRAGSCSRAARIYRRSFSSITASHCRHLPVVRRRKKIPRPPRLTFPLIVKSLNEDASWGISQASVVDSDEKLAERVAFIHESIGTAAIAEQYIEGRELYVGILGNERLRVFPIWELEFGNMPQGARLIATEKVKHDMQYQERHNIVVGPAKDLSPQLVESIKRAAKRIYRTLDLDGYARIDFRLSTDAIPHYIEAN